MIENIQIDTETLDFKSALEDLYQQSQVLQDSQNEEMTQFGFPIVIHIQQETTSLDIPCWAVEFSKTSMKILAPSEIQIHKDISINLSTVLKNNISLSAQINSCRSILENTFEIELLFH